MYVVDTVELKKIMIEKGFDKIIDLSEASAVDRNTLSKVLSGESKPSTTVIEKLMRTLEIPSEMAGPIFLNKTYVIRKKRPIKSKTKNFFLTKDSTISRNGGSSPRQLHGGNQEL